jgi:hypothetical protein
MRARRCGALASRDDDLRSNDDARQKSAIAQTMCPARARENSVSGSTKRDSGDHIFGSALASRLRLTRAVAIRFRGPNKEIPVNLQVTRRLLAGLSLVAPIALAVGCSAPSSSLSPTGPTAVVAASAQTAVSFSPNPDEPVCGEGQVFDPIKNECVPVPPPPPPPGVGCSPGYWKNHLTEFNASCDAAAAVPGDRFTSCGDLLTALTCKGSDASCGRNEAAGLLNGVSGCTESD